MQMVPASLPTPQEVKYFLCRWYKHISDPSNFTLTNRVGNQTRQSFSCAYSSL